MKLPLTARILAGMLLGIATGVACHAMLPSADATQFGGYFSLFADLFLRLIKMIIAPLVFCTLVIGVTRIGDVHAVGRIGLRTLGWFLVASDREWANPPKCHQSGRTIRLSVSFDQIQGEFK